MTSARTMGQAGNPLAALMFEQRRKGFLGQQRLVAHDHQRGMTGRNASGQRRQTKPHTDLRILIDFNAIKPHRHQGFQRG